MTLGVESGMDYLNVLNRIMILSRPGPFREELEIVAGQIRMGKQRAEAWLELGERIRLREIRSLVLTLVQTDRNGTPLSDSLLGLSRDAREESFRRAEKRAFEMPVKMLFPLLGFIFPAVFILIFEPLLLRFLRLL
jgi:tight adherence protein C